MRDARKQQNGDRPCVIGKSKEVVPQAVGVLLGAKYVIKPWASAQVYTLAHFSVNDPENARPDADIASQIDGDGIRASAQHIPWAGEQRKPKKNYGRVSRRKAESCQRIRIRPTEIEGSEATVERIRRGRWCRMRRLR